MTPDRKYFGMTIPQIGILVGLIVLVCLLFGGTGFFALRRFLLPQSQTDRDLMQSTATPFLLPTQALTVTPTSIPYEQMIPEGWEQHKTTLVELWLPAGFKSTDKKSHSFISGTSAPVEISLIGPSPTTSKDTVEVSISYEPLIGDSLDSLLESRLSAAPEGVRLAEQHKVMINSMNVNRLLFERSKDNSTTDQLVYVFLDGSTIWYVEYAADIKDFFEMLPVFDDSVRTFRMVR